MRADNIQFDTATAAKNKWQNIGIVIAAATVFIIVTGVMVGAITILGQPTPQSPSTTTPENIITSTPTPTPTPIPTPTPEPSPSPTPAPEVVNVSSLTIRDMTDPEYLALQQLANEEILYGQKPNNPPSQIGLGNVSVVDSSPYPWIKYGYNDSQPWERRYMWTPQKFLTVANGEAERYTLYNEWAAAQKPTHSVSGTVELYDQYGRLIHPNDPIIVGTLATAVVTLNNNQQGDPIGYIGYTVKLYRYNAAMEGLELMYSVSDDHVEAAIIPGQPWTKKIARDIPLQPGRWKGIITVYNQLDGAMLCEIRTGEYDVGIDHGDGIISFG